MIRLITVCLAGFLIGYAPSHGQNTTRPGLHREQAQAQSDTNIMLTRPAMLTAAGYSKPQGSDVETVFMTNSDTCAVYGCYVSVTYTTMDGRMLHRRNVELPDYIPAGETRLISFRSWDPQHDFYFYLNESPRQDNKMPYRVAITVDSARVMARNVNVR